MKKTKGLSEREKRIVLKAYYLGLKHGKEEYFIFDKKEIYQGACAKSTNKKE